MTRTVQALMRAEALLEDGGIFWNLK